MVGTGTVQSIFLYLLHSVELLEQPFEFEIFKTATFSAVQVLYVHDKIPYIRYYDNAELLFFLFESFEFQSFATFTFRARTISAAQLLAFLPILLREVRSMRESTDYTRDNHGRSIE